MNRRGFIGALIGLSMSPVLAKIPPGFYIEKSKCAARHCVDWKVFYSSAILNANWIAKIEST